MKATIQQSTALESQPQASGANPTQTASLKPQYDALAARFKSLSAALVPLSQEVVVLDQSKANLLEWRRSITRQSGYALRALLLHVGTIVVALGLVLLLSEVWRRATFRYIPDVRRRRQFLTIRRFVVGFLMGIVLVLGFVSEFSSLGCAVLVGASRKSFIGKVLSPSGFQQGREANERLWGTAATVAWAVAQGARVVRVHDVAEMTDVIRMVEAVKAAQ